MKKTYKAPALIIVGINTHHALMQTSYEISDKQLSDTSAGWAKEESTPITDKSVWDNEW